MVPGGIVLAFACMKAAIAQRRSHAVFTGSRSCLAATAALTAQGTWTSDLVLTDLRWVGTCHSLGGTCSRSAAPPWLGTTLHDGTRKKPTLADHGRHALHIVYVSKRVTIEQHKIRKLSSLDGANLCSEAQEVGRVGGRGPKCFGRREA